jgi:predicted MFS family arabinose efflux permease
VFGFASVKGSLPVGSPVQAAGEALAGWCSFLAVMVKVFISLVREHDIFDILAIVVLWGVGFLAVLSIPIWSVAVSTVVSKASENLTISWALGRLVSREVRSVFLKDLTDVVARERAYGSSASSTWD